MEWQDLILCILVKGFEIYKPEGVLLPSLSLWTGSVVQRKQPGLGFAPGRSAVNWLSVRSPLSSSELCVCQLVGQSSLRTMRHAFFFLISLWSCSKELQTGWPSKQTKPSKKIMPHILKV